MTGPTVAERKRLTDDYERDRIGKAEYIARYLDFEHEPRDHRTICPTCGLAFDAMLRSHEQWVECPHCEAWHGIEPPWWAERVAADIAADIAGEAGR